MMAEKLDCRSTNLAIAKLVEFRRAYFPPISVSPGLIAARISGPDDPGWGRI
jgi:hypothetical protein